MKTGKSYYAKCENKHWKTGTELKNYSKIWYSYSEK